MATALNNQTYRNLPLNSEPVSRETVARLMKAEWERFTKDTAQSGIESDIAQKSIPMGVPSSFQYWDPYPISITGAQGAYMTDVDGRQLLDLSMGFGAILGIAISLGIAFYIYKLGAKLNLRRFFRILGVVLMIFAAGLVADAIQNMQELNWLHLGAGQLWNTSRFVSEDSNFGDILHQLFGYADRPSPLQATSWALYMVAGISLFVYLGRIKPQKKS